MRFRVDFRRLLRSRAFVITAVLVLGLGLGVNTILFNTVYALLWRPLSFPQPDRLVTLTGRSNGGELANQITGRDAWALKGQPEVLAESGVTGNTRTAVLFDGDDTLEMRSAGVDSGYFRTLGLRPAAGRLFGEEEDLGQNPEPRAILTEAAWRSHFASDPSVVGRVLQEGAGRRPLRIVGVVRSDATLPFVPEAEILTPLASAGGTIRSNAGDALYHSVARLQAGVSVAQASARIDAVLQAEDRGSKFGVWGRHWLDPLRSALAPINPRTIFLLYGSACLLLVLTCANLASLFVARSMAHTHETSVHLALGATRWHIMAAYFREALLVCAAGTGLAFAVESWVRPLVPRYIPELRKIGPELLATGPALLVFGLAIWLAVSLAVTVVCGLRLRIGSLAAALSQAGRGGMAGGGTIRAVLAAAQLATVLILLTVAGLVGRSFLSAVQTDPGFDPSRVLAFQASLRGTQRSMPGIADLANRIAAIPGVKGVTYSTELPVGSGIAAATAAHPGSLLSTDPMLGYGLIAANYFDVLGTGFAAGREFTEAEVQESRPVVILNEAAAKVLFPGEAAVGKTVQPAFRERCQVVGVVRNILTRGLDQPPVPMVYTPYLLGMGGLNFLVRTGGEPAALVGLLKARVAGNDSGVLLLRFRSLRDVLDETIRRRVVAGVLVGGFALLGLIVSSVGLYGTLAVHIHQRRREIGVRIALGASVRAVVLTVMREGLRIAGAGAIAGLAGSALAASLIRPQLFGIGPLDWISFSAALLLLLVAAMAASLIPALSASRVDPIVATRD